MDKLDPRRFLNRLLQLFRRDPDPQDPYAYVRVPLKKGPGSLRASVVLKDKPQPRVR